MNSFFLTFAVGIGIIFSLAGWGVLVVKALRIRFSTGFGFSAAVGLALSTSVGAFLNWFHIATPGVIRTYLLLGLLIAAFVGARHARSLRDRTVSAWAYFRRRRFMALGALLLVSVTLVKYSTAISPGQFHPQDDYHAYFVFPVEMIQTGSLGQDPFSERRIVSSLGGETFLDTFPLSVTGEVRNFRLLDEGVAFIILLLLLAKIMIRKNIPGHWILIALLAASVYPAPISNITSVYGGIVLLVLLFDLLDRTVARPGVNHAALLAIVLASLTSLKTTFAPMAGVFFLSFFLFQLFRLPAKGKTVARAGFCVALIVILLLPWMLYSYHVSGTLFYPIFGKGFHGSRYGTYLLPTADMGIHNILAFFNGLANTVGAVLAAQVCLVLLALRGNKHGNKHDTPIELIVVVNLLIDVVFIGIGTGGVQMYRYSFAILFAAVLFLLIEQLVVFAKPSASTSPLSSLDSVAAILLLGMLLGAGWHGFMAEQKDWRLAALRFSLTGQDIVSASEVSAYRDMQLSIPPGQTVLVRLDKNFLLDFRRNPIYINDLPGGASLPPGIPIFKGPEALADYLVSHGIRYVAYSYADEATFSRAEFSSRLEPDVNVWIRKGAQIAFDFQDNVVALGRTRKKLFDNGKMFVLDLTSPSSPTDSVDRSALMRPAAMTVAPPTPAPKGPVVNVNPGMSTPALQGAISRAPRGATILFAAGTYNIRNQLTIPCNNLQITGPVATTPTAILAASFTNAVIFAYDGGCASLGSIKYLHFENTGAVYFGVGDNSNLAFEYNLITNLPSNLENTSSEPGLFFDGSLSTTLKNVLIWYNTFGDANSCSAVFATGTDEGGYCAGVITSQGQDENLTIEYNNFIHVEEGIHFNQLATFNPGHPNSVCVSCTVEYNYVLNYHRIGIEIQVSTPSNSILVEHNAVVDPLGSSYGTFAVSLACCQSGYTIGTNGHSPALIFNDNVLVATQAGYQCPPYGVEFWGTGSQGTNSLVQGTFCNGYTWGYGVSPWAIKNNYICGPNYAAGGGYISNQQRQSNPPAQSGNITGPSCSVTASTAPAISPLGGSFSGPQVVTLSDSRPNTGIWYTTDGSTPVPGSGTAQRYTAPFIIAKTTAVKTVGMWGAANQPLRYPSGYGYVPSSVVTASYTVSASLKRPVSDISSLGGSTEATQGASRGQQLWNR